MYTSYTSSPNLHVKSFTLWDIKAHKTSLVRTTQLGIVATVRKVASSNTSRLEAHDGFFQIAYEGDFRSLRMYF